MKAIRVGQFGDESVLKIEEVADPRPGPGQVVVRLAAAGVNPVETYIRSGKYGPREFPYTPGSDGAGIVESVGDGVVTAKPGDRVYVFGADGTYAERVVVDGANVRPLVERFSFDQGAAIGVPWATAYRALFVRGDVKPAETVLVHGGSGAVGLAAVQLAVSRGCVVFGTAGTAAGSDLIRSHGAAEVFDHTKPDHFDDVLKATGGRGVDAIIEMSSDKNLDRDLTILAKLGRVVVVGNRGPIQIDPRQTMGRDADIRGMTLMNADAKELAMIHAGLNAGFVAGTLTPVVAESFALSRAGDAHRRVMTNGVNGKITLRPGE